MLTIADQAPSVWPSEVSEFKQRADLNNLSPGVTLCCNEVPRLRPRDHTPTQCFVGGRLPDKQL
jgi:hypothetical protein